FRAPASRRNWCRPRPRNRSAWTASCRASRAAPGLRPDAARSPRTTSFGEQLPPARRHLLRRLGVLGGRRRGLLPRVEEVRRSRLPLLQLVGRERLERAALLLDVGDGLFLEIADPGKVVLHGFRGLLAKDVLDVLRQARPGALAHRDVMAGQRHHGATMLLADLDQPVLL